MFASRRWKSACAALALLAMPAQAQACWLTNCFSRPTQTFYAPVAVAPAPVCNPCQQTVAFAPQPVCNPCQTTVLRPAPVCNPCGGVGVQPTTTFMPTSLPYTSFRPLTTTNYTPSVFASPIPSTSYYQSAPMNQPTFIQPAAVAPAAGCCGTGVTTTSYATPVMGRTVVNASPINPAPMVGHQSVAPIFANQPRAQIDNGASPSDRIPSERTPADRAPSLKPIPDLNETPTKNNSTSLPKLLDPQNRTAAAMPTWSYTPVAMREATAATQIISAKPAVNDNDGWSAAGR